MLEKIKLIWKTHSIIILWSLVAFSLFIAGFLILRITNSPDNVKTVSSNSQAPEKQSEFWNSLLKFFENKSPDQKTTPEIKSAPEIKKEIVSENLEFRSSTWFSDYGAMKKNIHLYNEVHPFIYLMKGGVTNNGDIICIWSKTSRKERVAEMRALNPNVKIIPTIFRWENPKEKISENIGMNGKTEIRDKHINNILEEIETYGYDGIDIDYEGMTCNKKEKFEEFIALLSKELKKRNKLLSIAVHPKTPASKTIMVKCKGLKNQIRQDFAENWRGPMTHDYEYLSKYADKIKIMAYELHPRKYRNPGPGPQAPNVWLANIIDYARERIPVQKLYMAIPTYGYDWALNCNTRAKAVYFDDAVRLKSGNVMNYQPTNIDKIYLDNPKRSKSWRNLSKFRYIHENKTYEDPSIWYTSGGCDRVAFYMNKRAFESKMNLLRKYKLGGFSFWQLLSENDPGINEYLSLLVSNKLPPVKTYDEEMKEKELARKAKEILENANKANTGTESPEKTTLSKKEELEKKEKTETGTGTEIKSN